MTTWASHPPRGGEMAEGGQVKGRALIDCSEPEVRRRRARSTTRAKTDHAHALRQRHRALLRGYWRQRPSDPIQPWPVLGYFAVRAADRGAQIPVSLHRL